jgi:hypothetical protein
MHLLLTKVISTRPGFEVKAATIAVDRMPFGFTREQALVLSIGLAISIFALLGFVAQPEDRYPSDFYGSWSGARLLGPDLYNPAAAESTQHAVSPKVDVKRYIRPPLYAILIWPLGQLPFPVAYVIWQLLNIAAVIVFVRIWRFEPAAYIACALFLPLDWSFGIGQDAPIMLMLLATGAQWIQCKRPIAGGGMLAMCAIKPHLFVFVPVVLLAQKRYRALAGMLTAGAGLYLVCAAVMGFAWPVSFLHAATTNETAISPRLLGVSGLLARFHAPVWMTLIAGLAGAAIVFAATRGRDWIPSLGFGVAAGVTFAPHAMMYDGSLFLPLLLLESSAAIPLAAGAALSTVVTPARIVGEIAAPVLLWIARPRG